MPPDPPRLAKARQFLMSVSTGRAAPAAHLLAPDVTYTVAGRNRFAGRFEGPEEVEQHLRRFLTYTSGTFDVLKWVDWMVGDTHVAALQYAQVQGHGAIFRGHQLFVIGFDDVDTVTDIQVYFDDQEGADYFLSL